MARQLHSLLEIAQHPDVRLRIVPGELTGDAGLHTPFSVIEFPRKKSVVYLPHPTTRLFLEHDDMIESYQRRVIRIAKFAMEPTPSLDLVASITREFELAQDTKDDPSAGTHVASKAGSPRRGSQVVKSRRIAS